MAPAMAIAIGVIAVSPTMTSNGPPGRYASSTNAAATDQQMTSATAMRRSSKARTRICRV